MEMIYVPFAQSERQEMTLLLEGSGDAAGLAPPLRELVRSLDPGVPIHDVRTMEDLFYLRAVSVSRIIVETVASMGLLGLALALVGLYGLMAYSVSRRTREIGIRMAIGADRGAVIGMVARQGLALALLGIALGLAASAGVSRLLASLVTGVAAADPVALVALPLALLAVTMVATVVPALRAARIDPVSALRQE
jgi:ABC-type lipoprotein release transport system permease subunit